MLGLFGGAYWGPRNLAGTISTDEALLPIVMEKGELRTVTCQVTENGVAKDCSGYTAQWGVKERLTDAAYKIGPIAGVFSDDADGKKSMLSFTITPDLTKALAAFGGVFSVAIYDGSGNKVVLTERGGVSFTLREDVLDVL